MDIAARLQSHPLFATFTPEALAEIVRAATPVIYEKGDVCVRLGEAGEIFGILISGRLEARGRPASVGAAPELLGSVAPGEFFGEMSLLTGNPTVADVVAVEKSQAVVFLQEAIGPLIAGNPQAVRLLTRLMTARLAPPAGREASPRPAAVKFSLGASEPMRVLSVSCRMDDMRYSYFDTSSRRAIAGGAVSKIGADEAVHTHWGPAGKGQTPVVPSTHEAALAAALAALTGAGVLGSASELSAVGHRVCHGGAIFAGPEIVDEKVKAEIRRLAVLAPFENPFNLAGIEACQRLAPGVPQVAVFDTAFHLKMPTAAYRYALPSDLVNEPELRRFGGHGISHQGAARAACAFMGANFNAIEIIVCHLGTGASLAAIDHGRPVGNTMGLTPLSGLVMSTRPGDLDPGLLLHLICDRGIDPKLLAKRLYTESGLLGLSGISGDARTVLEAAGTGDPRALLAMEVFCRRAHAYLSAYASLLGSADAIVFTGGVGENAPGIRARICQNLGFLGIRLDEMRNRSARVSPGEVVEISQSHSTARVLVAGGNEDYTIACKAVRALSQKRVTDVIRRRKGRAIPISPSAHHVHLTAEHVEALFGPGHSLTRRADLSQPGEFACEERVNLLGPKGRVDGVRVLCPIRRQTQVEIARTEEFKLGIDAPVRMSGDLEGTPGVTLEGPAGRVALERGVICAMRHIHMSPREAMEFAVRDRDVVRVRIAGKRSLIFGDVVVRVSPDFRLDMHIDTDEANAAEIGPGAVGYLDSIQERAASA